jgi:hypothetical protein
MTRFEDLVMTRSASYVYNEHIVDDAPWSSHDASWTLHDASWGKRTPLVPSTTRRGESDSIGSLHDASWRLHDASWKLGYDQNRQPYLTTALSLRKLGSVKPLKLHFF